MNLGTIVKRFVTQREERVESSQNPSIVNESEIAKLSIDPADKLLLGLHRLTYADALASNGKVIFVHAKEVGYADDKVLNLQINEQGRCATASRGTDHPKDIQRVDINRISEKVWQAMERWFHTANRAIAPAGTLPEIR